MSLAKYTYTKYTWQIYIIFELKSFGSYYDARMNFIQRKKDSFFLTEHKDYTSMKPGLGCGAESQPLPFSPQQRGALRERDRLISDVYIWQESARVY